MRPVEGTGPVGGKPCWESVRDNRWVTQTSDAFFNETLDGRHCDTNWFEGNPGSLGTWGAQFPGNLGSSGSWEAHAPALLGFDETIDEYCGQHVNANFYGPGAHAERCVAANVNILSLYGDHLPYNICRNLEWQTCAAQGKLPGQGGSAIKFAKAPHTLELVRNNRLGVCSGWVPARKPEGGIYGYATDDIFYLETCMYSQMCSNGHDIFRLEEGERFNCACPGAEYWH